MYHSTTTAISISVGDLFPVHGAAISLGAYSLEQGYGGLNWYGQQLSEFDAVINHYIYQFSKAGGWQ